MIEFIVDWRSRNYPIDLESIFNRNSETELEIGFGNGIFLLQSVHDALRSDIFNFSSLIYQIFTYQVKDLGN